MKLPSCTARTRSAAGLKVIVSVTLDTRDAPVIDTGTVYGPPPTRNSVPGGVTSTCAAAGVAAGGVAGGTAAGGVGGGAVGAPGGGCAGGTAGAGTGVGKGGTVVVPGI